MSYSKGGKVGSVVFEHDEVFSGADADRLETVIGEVYPDSNIVESNDTKYTVNNMSAPYAIATVTKTNLFGFKHKFVVMVVAVSLSESDAVLVQYIADPNDFDKLLPQAEHILQSIRSSAPSTNL